MPKPKEPPLSVRFTKARIEMIDAYAAKRGITRHAAVLLLVAVGLDEPVVAPVTPEKPKPAPKVEAETVKVAVPVFERRTFRPNPKKKS